MFVKSLLAAAAGAAREEAERAIAFETLMPPAPGTGPLEASTRGRPRSAGPQAHDRGRGALGARGRGPEHFGEGLRLPL